MKKTFLTLMLWVVLISLLGIGSYSNEIKADEIIKIKSDGINAYKTEQKIDSEVVVVYDFAHFVSEIYATGGKSTIGDIFNKAEKDGMKKYLTDARTGSRYDGIYKTIVNAESKISFKGKEYEVLDSLYFCSGEYGILATVHLANELTIVDLGKYGMYTWEEHSEIFGYFMEYGKPLYAWQPYYFEYFTSVFPFLDLEDKSESLGKEVEVNTESDLEKLKKFLFREE